MGYGVGWKKKGQFIRKGEHLCARSCVSALPDCTSVCTSECILLESGKLSVAGPPEQGPSFCLLR